MRLEIPEKNEHDLYFRMNDLAAFSKLLYALKEVNHILRINFTPAGLFLSEFAANRNILLFCSFKKQNFVEYNCTGPGFFAVNCSAFYKVLQNHHQRDELAFTYLCPSDKQKNREQLRFEIIKDPTLEQRSEYTIPLYFADKEMYESAIEQVDMMSIIDLKDFHHFVSSIKDIEIGDGDQGGTLSLYVSNEQVTLERHSGQLLSECRLTLLTAEGKQNKRNLLKRFINPETVVKTFFVKHLAEVLKFFDISNQDASVLIYIKVDPPDFPVIFEVSVGAIGLLRIAFSPAQVNA